MKTTLINRVYPENDWDFKAVSTTTTNSSGHLIELIYCHVKTCGIEHESFETYTGKNYIVDSTNKSYSTSVHDISKVPAMYKNVLLN